jgi:DNA-binding HxlR family transcriptional regulator
VPNPSGSAGPGVSFVTIMAPQITVDVPSSVCPVLATARIVAGKWTLLMLRDLADGPRRFSELQRSLAGISPRTLSVRLRALEEEGILERREFAEMPPRVEYRLTEKGSHLVPIVEAMREYGSRWLGAAEDCDEALLEAVAS